MVHVAGINLAWRACEESVRQSTTNAARLALAYNYSSIAFPLIGAGSGSFDAEKSAAVISASLTSVDLDAGIVRWRPR